MFEKLNSKNVKKTFAMLSLALAGIAFNGCGGGKDTWKVSAQCLPGQELVVENVNNATVVETINIACRGKGKTSEPIAMDILEGPGSASSSPDGLDTDILTINYDRIYGLNESISLYANIPATIENIVMKNIARVDSAYVESK